MATSTVDTAFHRTALPLHTTLSLPLSPSPRRLVDQLEALCPSVPSLFHCTSLTVQGRVRFEAGVAIRGDVMLTNSESLLAARPPLSLQHALLGAAAAACGAGRQRLGRTVKGSPSEL